MIFGARVHTNPKRQRGIQPFQPRWRFGLVLNQQTASALRLTVLEYRDRLLGIRCFKSSSKTGICGEQNHDLLPDLATDAVRERFHLVHGLQHHAVRRALSV